MLPLSYQLKHKYGYVIKVYYDNPILFLKISDDGQYIDDQEYSDIIFEADRMGDLMKLNFRKFMSYQRVMYRRFLKKRDKLQRKFYVDLLRPYFCEDIASYMSCFLV